MANCLKNRNFSEICPEKSIILVKLPEKIEIFSPGSTTPQFSKQIDAAVHLLLCFCWNSGNLVLWAIVMLHISKSPPSDSRLLQCDRRTTPSRHLYVMEV